MIEYKNDTMELELSSNIPLNIRSNAIVKLFQLLDIFVTQGIPELTYLGMIMNTQCCYTYEFRDNSGRSWLQNMVFADYSDNNPEMDFDTDGFKLREFKHQRQLRLHLIKLVNIHEMTSLEVKWF